MSRRVWHEHVECTMQTAFAALTLSVPFSAHPTFATDVVKVDWRLEFEFQVESAKDKYAPLQWNLPVILSLGSPAMT